MLWFRLLGLPDPQHEANQQRHRQADIRVAALLAHQQRALDALDRELELYRVQTHREPRS